MRSNAPEFLANVCEAIYAEDPLGFEFKKAWDQLDAARLELCDGFYLAATTAREAMIRVDKFTAEIEAHDE